MSTPPPPTWSIVFTLKCLERQRSAFRCLRSSWVIFDSRFVAPSPLFVCYCFGHSHEHSHSTSQSICTILTHANSKNTHSRTNHAEFVHGFTLNATQYYLKFKYFCELNFVLEKNDSVLHKMHMVCWSINVIYALKQHQHNTKYLSFQFWLFHLFPSTRLYRNVWARFLLLANLYHWQYKM